MSKSEKKAIGIDLGSTVCKVGVFENGKLEIILNGGETCGGNSVTNNCITFTNGENSLGCAPKIQMTDNPQCAVYDFKNLIPKECCNKKVEQNFQVRPFKLCGNHCPPNVEVVYKYEDGNYISREMTEKIVAQVKEMMKNHLGQPVEDAVLAVPKCCNDNREEQIIRSTGCTAGLTLLRIINEPRAPVAYGFLERNGEKHVYVFDLGPGNLGFSINKSENGVMEMTAIPADPQLGGEDLDAPLISFFAKEFENQYGIKITGNKDCMRKLQLACADAERALSCNSRASVKIDNLINGINFETLICRPSPAGRSEETIKLNCC